MRMIVAAQFEQMRRETGFTWKKVLLLTMLGAGLGVAFVFLLPLQVT